MSRHNIRARVYIGRLPSRATERDVTKFFKSFGRIIDIQLKNGYGFVEFDDPRDADDAVYDMNGRELSGERVIIEHAKGPPRSVVERERYSRSGGGGGRYDDRRRRRGRSRSRSGSRSRSRSRDRRRRRRSRSRSRSRSPRSRSYTRSRSNDRRRRESPPRRKRSPSRSISRSMSRSRSRSRARSASPPRKVAQIYRVEIENLPPGTSVQELEDFMATAGKIMSCELKDEGKGFVDYEEEAGQVSALETLSVAEFKETKLTLLKGEVKTTGNSRSRSRSRTRSHSRSSSRGHYTNGNGNGNGKATSRSRSRSDSRSRSGSRSSHSRSPSPQNGDNNGNGHAGESGSEH